MLSFVVAQERHNRLSVLLDLAILLRMKCRGSQMLDAQIRAYCSKGFADKRSATVSQEVFLERHSELPNDQEKLLRLALLPFLLWVLRASV